MAGYLFTAHPDRLLFFEVYRGATTLYKPFEKIEHKQFSKISKTQ